MTGEGSCIETSGKNLELQFCGKAFQIHPACRGSAQALGYPLLQGVP